MALEFTCQGCGAVLTVEAAAGTKIVCPECRAQQVVPESSRLAGPGVAVAGVTEAVHELDWYRVVAGALPWVLSVAMHGALLLVLAFIAWSTIPVDAASREVVIPSPILGEDPGGSLQPGPENDLIEPPLSELEQLDMAAPLADPLQSPILVTSRSPSADRLAMALTGAGSATGGTIGTILPLEGGGRPGPPSMFMGTGGQARRVCYIIDRSGSMAVAFDYVRRELFRSIQDLENEHLFHVIFFNAGEPIEAAQRKFIPASDIHKVETIEFVATIVPTGRTDPRPAFRRAFALSPKPDLIYFLTDGAFDPDLLEDLRRFNADRKTRINTIAFLSRPAEELLKQIARENGGTYVFVNPGAQAGENP